MQAALRPVLRNCVNALLSPLGLGIARRKTLNQNAQAIKDRFCLNLQEMEEVFRDRILPNLNSCPGRHPLMTQLSGCGMVKAFYLIDALHQSLRAPGDVCEFGVAEGATSALLANEIFSTSRHLWLYDSFKGLPAPSEKDVLIDDIFNLGSMKKYEGWMSTPVDQVKNRLAALSFPESRTHIVEGFLSRTSPLPASVCFAFLDFDFYEPIRLALELLNDRVSSGGAIAIDDYGYFSTGPQTAVDEFLAQHSKDYSLHLPGSFTRGFAILKKN